VVQTPVDATQNAPATHCAIVVPPSPAHTSPTAARGAQWIVAPDAQNCVASQGAVGQPGSGVGGTHWEVVVVDVMVAKQVRGGRHWPTVDVS
jgi:hypothetical protein